MCEEWNARKRRNHFTKCIKIVSSGKQLISDRIHYRCSPSHSLKRDDDDDDVENVLL